MNLNHKTIKIKVFDKLDIDEFCAIWAGTLCSYFILRDDCINLIKLIVKIWKKHKKNPNNFWINMV